MSARMWAISNLYYSIINIFTCAASPSEKSDVAGDISLANVNITLWREPDQLSRHCCMFSHRLPLWSFWVLLGTEASSEGVGGSSATCTRAFTPGTPGVPKRVSVLFWSGRTRALHTRRRDVNMQCFGHSDNRRLLLSAFISSTEAEIK